MGNIPTDNSIIQLPAQGAGPRANPADFARPWQAAAELGAGLQEAGGVAGKIFERQRYEEALKYTSSTHANMVNALSEFHAANQDSETYATDFKKFSESLFQGAVANAPSGLAAQHITMAARSSIDSMYANALLQTERNKQAGAVISVQQDIGSLMQATRNNAASSGNQFAIDQFGPWYYSLLANVDERYSGLAPKTAARLKEMVTQQAVLGMADIDPNEAKRLLSESPHVDEGTRATLNAHIDRSIAEHGLLGAHIFKGDLGTALQQADIAKTPVVRPSDVQFQTAFGKHWELEKLEFAKAADAHDRAVGTYAALKDKNWSYQSARLGAMYEKLQADAKDGKINPTESAAFSKVFGWLDESRKLQETDPVTWQRQYQEPVAAAFRLADQAAATAEIVAKASPNSGAAATAAAEARMKRHSAWDTLLSYQGYAPADASIADAGMYLGKADSQTHVLSPVQAATFAANLRTAGPNQMAGMVDHWKRDYGNMFPHFWHDLITLPPEASRIPKSMELGFNISDPTTQAAYFQSQINQEALKSLTDDKRVDMEKALHTDPAWMALTTSMLGEYNQRAETFRGYQGGIINYANSMLANGQANNPKDAVQKAIKGTIGAELVFTPPVNGRVIAIPRNRQYTGPLARLPRTEQDATDIGLSLENLLWRVTPQFVKTDDALGRVIFPKIDEQENELQKANYVRKVIGQGGQWVTDKDGESATLYVRNDAGQAEQLLDKLNRPWRVRWDDLPKMERIVKRASGFEGFAQDATVIPGQKPADRGPIKPELIGGDHQFWEGVQFRFGPGMFQPYYRTNWPTMPPEFNFPPAKPPAVPALPATSVQKLPKK